MVMSDYLGGLNPVTSVLVREREIWCAQKRRQCDHRVTDWGTWPHTQQGQQPPEAGRGKDQIPASSPRRGRGPADGMAAEL